MNLIVCCSYRGVSQIERLQLQKRNGNWIFVLPNLGVSDLKNCTNYSKEHESKNSAQLVR